MIKNSYLDSSGSRKTSVKCVGGNRAPAAGCGDVRGLIDGCLPFIVSAVNASDVVSRISSLNIYVIIVNVGYCVILETGNYRQYHAGYKITQNYQNFRNWDVKKLSIYTIMVLNDNLFPIFYISFLHIIIFCVKFSSDSTHKILKSQWVGYFVISEIQNYRPIL